jgi:serine phosphatase RsbU (regulator of sigma subunit)
LLRAPSADEARWLVAEASRSNGLAVPVMVVLDAGDSADRAAVLESGADDCLIQPVSGRELRARLARLSASAGLAQQAARSSALLARELGHAERVQRFILPLKPPPVEGLEIVAEYLPAATLGGDFFDILPFAQARAGFLVADVAGHGIGAALNAMLLKSQLAVWARPDIPVVVTLSLLNNYLCALTDLDYATAVYAVIDARAPALEYALAGHPAPLLLRRGQAAPLPPALEPRSRTGAAGDAPFGVPLGLYEAARYASGVVELAAGDRLLLFTDGLIDWHDSAGEPLGLDGLVALLEQSHDRPLAEQVAWLLGRLQERSAGAAPADDVNVVAVQIV